MEPGAYAFCLNVPVGKTQRVNIPIDVVIQPKKPRTDQLPIRIEARSAGDFTTQTSGARKRRRRITGYRRPTGRLWLSCSSFAGISATTIWGAPRGIDRVWEHRIDDLGKLELEDQCRRTNSV
ncbi:MAG: hypothetical protein KatS3mg058_2655 [Roseiflexus sp.]|nr:MAG: hypothetical protein KatS3mg058_2655 [Roseiflexus sp.]